MKTVVVEGQVFAVPTYIKRLPYGWQVCIPGHKSKSFAASVHGSWGAAHVAALAHRFALLPATQDAPVGCNLAERKDKSEPTGIPGVMLRRQPATKWRGASVSLLVKPRGGRTSCIYVGTPANYLSRLDAKLARAAALVQRDA
jgi:hypothetical protein